MIVARVLFSDDPHRLRRIVPGRTERDPVYIGAWDPRPVDAQTEARLRAGILGVLRRIATEAAS